MLHALQQMSSRIEGMTQEQYGKLRRDFSAMMTERLTGKPSRAKGAKWSEDAKRKKSNSNHLTGKTYVEVFGEKRAAEIKNLRSQSAKGHEVSEETREKLRKPKTEEQKRRISESKKGHKMHENTRAALLARVRDDTKNPCVNQTIYEFRHKVTGEVVWERQIDMCRKYKCVLIARVLRNPNLKSSRGWIYTGNKKEKK
jgi:hypothetical protein